MRAQAGDTWWCVSSDSTPQSPASSSQGSRDEQGTDTGEHANATQVEFEAYGLCTCQIIYFLNTSCTVAKLDSSSYLSVCLCSSLFRCVYRPCLTGMLSAQHDCCCYCRNLMWSRPRPTARKMRTT